MTEEADALQETAEILADSTLLASIRAAEKELAAGQSVPLDELEQELGLMGADGQLRPVEP